MNLLSITYLGISSEAIVMLVVTIVLLCLSALMSGSEAALFSLTHREKQQMEESGLFVGGWIPALDTDRVEQTLLTDAKGIAWVSVNLKGTVAYVQLRPLLSPKETDASGQPANLVAAEDGVIESVRLMSGDVKVKPGDIVRKGQLLIGGVRETTDLGYVK